MSLKRTCYGIGYIGVGIYTAKFNREIYVLWNSIFKRSYSEKHHLIRPTYENCTVDEYFHNFQNFAKWYRENYIHGFVLDKDILIKGNKIYGPDTCCFVPQQINQLFTKRNTKRGELPIGVRKTSKINNTLNIYNVSFSKYGKHTCFGTYASIQEAFDVYKFEKEKYIKEIVIQYKNMLKENVYNILMEYQVEIDD